MNGKRSVSVLAVWVVGLLLAVALLACGEQAIPLGTGLCYFNSAGNGLTCSSGGAILLNSGASLTLGAGSNFTYGLGSNLTVTHNLAVQGAVSLTQTNAAGGSANPFDWTGTLGAMNGSDNFTLFDVNLTNANHTSTGNTVEIVDIANITGDADATEYGIKIGTGWDYGVYSDSPIVSGAGQAIYPANATNSSAIFACVNTIAYTDATTKTLCVLPANVDVVDVTFVVTTAFDDTGTDKINVGYSGDADHYVDDIDGATAGLTRMGGAATIPYGAIGDIGASNKTITGIYAGQNGNSAHGAAMVIVSYVVR